MANNKYNESIEDKAFKALDEALQIDFEDDNTPSLVGKKPDAPEAPVSEKPSTRNQQSQDEKPRRRGSAAPPRPGEQGSRAPAFAANDANRVTPASLLKSLDGGSSRPAIRNATLVSLLWIVGGLGLMSLLYSPQIWQIRSLADLVALPGVIAGMIGIIVPVLLFYAFAIMMSRAQDMRNAARSMAEVAFVCLSRKPSPPSAS
jgi:hypothetical protein